MGHRLQRLQHVTSISLYSNSPSISDPSLRLAIVKSLQCHDPNLNPKVRTASALTDIYSWENGTKAEAILEYTYPSLSVFSPTDPLPLSSSLSPSSFQSVYDIATTTLNNRPSTNTSAAAMGGSSLLADGAAGDPASLGVAVLLAGASDTSTQINGVSFNTAATSELTYLLYDVPKVRSHYPWHN